MKSINYISTIIVIFLTGYCLGQQPTLTINEFKSQDLEEFDGNGVTITTKKLQDGFTLRIKSSTSINKVELKKDGTFSENILPPPTSDASYSMIYTGVKPAIIGGIVEIQLTKTGESPVIVRLIVDQKDQVDTKQTELCKKDYDNMFGEQARYYDKNKIVYVYDFNKDPSKREFYKITLYHDTLKRELVNFNKETLTSGKNVKFKIYNINKFMYDVSIADSVIYFDSEPSALFSRFFLGDSTLLGSLMGTFSDNITKESNQEDSKLLMSKILDFVTKYNDLRKTALDALNPCHEFTCCNSLDYAWFLNSLAQIKAQSENVKRKLNKAKNDTGKEECNKQIKLKAQAEHTIKNLNFAILKLDIRIEGLTLKNNTLRNNVDKIKDDIKVIESQVFYSKGPDSLTKRAQLVRLEAEQTSKNNELATSLLDLSKAMKDRDSLDLKSFEFTSSIDSLEYNISEVCKTDANTDIQDMIDALEASNYLLSNLPSDTVIKKLIVFVNHMVIQNNSYTSDYISLNGNMLDLKIKISSKDSIFEYFSIPKYKNDPIEIQIPILGKPFVSFSSGSFIALGKNMQNKTYAWQETVGNNNTVDSSKYTLVESGYTLPPMGFCALGNLEWKVTRSFGLGGSFGVGLSIEKSPRLAYLGGVSLFFGDLRQFTITGGFAGMQVNKLTNNFQTIEMNQTIYTSKPNIDYYKEFKVGGFISLTYTPFKIYKTKTVKSQNK